MQACEEILQEVNGDLAKEVAKLKGKVYYKFEW